MMIEALTETDYFILKFIKNNNPVHLDDIKREFSNIDSLEYRIRALKTPDMRSSGQFSCPIPIPGTSYISEDYEVTSAPGDVPTQRGLEVYTITPLGKKVLQDYQIRNKRELKQIWLRHAWIPIIVSTITTVIIHLLSPLLSLIGEWLLRFH